MTPEESRLLGQVLAETKDIKDFMKGMKFDFNDKIDNVIESQNGKNAMLDRRITDECADNEKRIDKISSTVVEVEKEQNELKVKQAVSTTKLALAISGATFTITMIATAIFDYVVDMIKR